MSMKSPKYKMFGVELKRLRQAQGIATHTELAKLLGVAQQTVTRWEAGESRPRAEQVAVVAKALRADPQQLLVAAGHAGGPVTVSFSQPLPLPSLSPEDFQRFCRSLLEALYPGASVHAAGKTGHKQFGTDIEVECADGMLHSFQCKRESQLGPAKVRAAVKAHTASAARKFILLSRVASPLARQEVEKHRGWDIWDQDDISEKLRALSGEARRRLVDTFFPGQRFALLGEPSPGPWQTPEDFFAPLVIAGRPFSLHWEMVGRAKERVQLATNLDDGSQIVVSLAGPAGGGKSRTLRAAVDAFRQLHPRHTVLMLSPTEPVTAKSVEDLGFGEKLLVVDDAHDRTDLNLLVRYVANPEMRARLLLVYRSYAQDSIDRELGRYGLPSAMVTLQRPTEADAVALATQVLASLGGPVHAATMIAKMAYDSPLFVVVGAWILAKDGLHPELFGSHEVFQRTVLLEYQEAIKKMVSTSNRDQELIRRMLRVIALIQPVVPDDPKLFSLYESIEDVRAPDATRLTRLLIGSGVLFKRGARYRLSPDLLADSIIESECITPRGTSNGHAEKVFEAGVPEHKAHLLLNLGRLDWRRSHGDTSDSPLLDALWSGLVWEEDYVRAHLKAAVEAAYFQPRQALVFARRLVDEGHGTHEDVCRLIRNAAYTFKYLRECCELLWEIGRDDQRPLNQHPHHALRILTEMATPEPRVPIAYVELIVDFMLSVLPDNDSWTGAATPFDVLAGALATEGHFTSKATSRTVTFSAYGVNIETVRSIRRRIIDAILDSLASDNKRRAFEAAKTLQKAIQQPAGMMNREPSEIERAGWAAEFAEILERLNSLVERAFIPPVVLLRIAQSVGWHAHYAKEPTRGPAERILRNLNRDLETRVTRVLMDGWGSHTWKHEPDQLDRNDEVQRTLASEISQSLTDPKALASFVNERLNDLKGYGDEALQSCHIFMNRLLEGQTALARVVLDARAQTPETPIAAFAAAALAALIRHARDEADARIDALLASGDGDLGLIASAYTMGLDNQHELTEQDRTVLRRIFSSSDLAVLGCTPWLFRHVAERDKHFAIELLSSGNPALATASHHLFMWFGDDRMVPVDSLSADEIRGIFKFLGNCMRLDDRPLHDFLKRVAQRAPKAVVELAMDRLTRAMARDDWSFATISGFSRLGPTLDVLEHPDGPGLLGAVLDWSLPQIGDDRFAHHFRDLIAGVFGFRTQILTNLLEAWCAGGKSGHFQVVGHVLRNAPPSFVFEEHPFVRRILKAARSLGGTAYRELKGSMWISAAMGTRSGTPGKPFPEDLSIKRKAEETLALLSKGDPAYSLYDDLRKGAERDIERSVAMGRAMDEEDSEE